MACHLWVGCRTETSAPSFPTSPQSSATADFTPSRISAELTARSTPGGVELRLPWPPQHLWRGHGEHGALFQPVEVPLGGDPKKALVLDREVPDGTLLHYRAVSADGRQLTASFTSQPRVLPKLKSPRLMVDKRTYVLTVFDGDEVVKRYRIGLGADPSKRKICQDNQTTPEGLYTIINLQPQATFHRAYDLNYPNEVDRIRYTLGQQNGLIPAGRDIGGEIQIHGLGSAGNWTFGCVSLDNPELDEQFEQSALRTGTEVFLCGSEIRPGDRRWLRSPPRDKVAELQSRLQQRNFYRGAVDGSLGPATMEALGRYQLAEGLAPTCQLDESTRRHLGWREGL